MHEDVHQDHLYDRSRYLLALHYLGYEKLPYPLSHPLNMGSFYLWSTHSAPRFLNMTYF
jgi:hypothetical protein